MNDVVAPTAQRDEIYRMSIQRVVVDMVDFKPVDLTDSARASRAGILIPITFLPKSIFVTVVRPFVECFRVLLRQSDIVLTLVSVGWHASSQGSAVGCLQQPASS